MFITDDRTRMRCLSMSGRHWCARDANTLSGEKNKDRLRKRAKFRRRRTNIRVRWP